MNNKAKMQVETRNGIHYITWDDGTERETQMLIKELAELFIGLTLTYADFKAALFGYFFGKCSIQDVYNFLFDCDAEGVCIRYCGYAEPYYAEDDPAWAA